MELEGQLCADTAGPSSASLPFFCLSFTSRPAEMPVSKRFPFPDVPEQSPKPRQSLLYSLGTCAAVLVAFFEHRLRSGRDCLDVPQIHFNFFLAYNYISQLPLRLSLATG